MTKCVRVCVLFEMTALHPILYYQAAYRPATMHINMWWHKSANETPCDGLVRNSLHRVAEVRIATGGACSTLNMVGSCMQNDNMSKNPKWDPSTAYNSFSIFWRSVIHACRTPTGNIRYVRRGCTVRSLLFACVRSVWQIASENPPRECFLHISTMVCRCWIVASGDVLL